MIILSTRAFRVPAMGFSANAPAFTAPVMAPFFHMGIDYIGRKKWIARDRIAPSKM